MISTKIVLIICSCLLLSTCIHGPCIDIENEYWVSTINTDGTGLYHIIETRSQNVQFSPDGSKIIINRWENGIWTINPDGSEYTLISGNVLPSSTIPSTCIDSTGTVKIAFCGHISGKQDIFTVDLSGSNLTNITNTLEIREKHPSFSPNGDKIVFSSEFDSLRTLSTFKSNGTDLQEIIHFINIPNSTSYFAYPSFSLDGYKIYYQIISTDTLIQTGIYSINTDGTENHLLYEGSICFQFLSMGANYTKFVFFDDNHIYIMNEDGTCLTDLIEITINYCLPKISIDGSKIVYDDGEIYIMNSDGSNIQHIALGDDPIFSPDGEKIVFNGIKKIEVQY